ncbi:MAG: DVU_1557 family redox protein [Syntrophobacteraceae bacterium]
MSGQKKLFPEDLFCLKCGLPMEPGKVNISYLNGMFPVDLLKCPKCGLVFIPEELAVGKMAEVEKLLEDK